MPVAAGLALIIGLGGLIISLIDFTDSDDNGIRIQNQTAATRDSSEFVRTQEITFNSPFQLDTAQTMWKGKKFSSFGYESKHYTQCFKKLNFDKNHCKTR